MSIVPPPPTTAASRNQAMAAEPPTEPFFGLFLVLAGIAGLTASLALSIEKVEQLADPTQSLACDISVLVQCSKNLDSAQGAVLGFPNPFLGLVGFALVVGAGAAVWAAPRLARWFWVLFNTGVAGAFVLIVWLIGQSIYELGTLCPWCLLAWTVTIPLFLLVTARNARAGVFGPALMRPGAAVWPWIPLVTIIAFGLIALLAQLRLNVLAGL